MRWGPTGIVVAASLALGGVHAPVRAALCALLLAWSVGVLLTQRRESAGHLAPWLVGPLGLALLAALIPLLPVPPSVRASLVPELARLEAVAGVTGWRPMAPDPGAALRGLAVMGAVWLAMVASLDARIRPRHLTAAAVAGGSCTALVGLAGPLAGLETPLGLGRGEGATWFGPFISANHAGAMLAASAGMALFSGERDKRWRVWWWSAAALCVIGLLFSGSRGAPLHLGVGLSAGAALRFTGWKRLIGLASLVAIPIAALNLPEAWLHEYSEVMDANHYRMDPYGGRLAFYPVAARLMLVGPWAGLGAGGFATAYRTLFAEPKYADFPHAHNEWLQVVIEQGLPGAVLLAVLLVAWVVAVGRETHGFAVASVAGAAALASAATIDFPLRALSLALVAAWIVVLPFKGESSQSRPLRKGAALSLSVLLLLAHAGWGIYGRAGSELAAAREAFEGEQFAEAERSIRLALRRRPLDGRVWNLGAWIAYRQGDGAEAMTRIERAVAITPNLPGPWLGLARLRVERDDLDGADEAYARLLELDLPRGTETKVVKEVLTVRGLDPTVRALMMWPEKPQRQCEMALELARMGELGTGQLLMDPEARTLCRMMWAQVLLSAGEPGAALAELGSATGCVADQTAGRALLVLGDVAALPRLEAAMRRCEDKSLPLRVALGQAKIRSGDPDGIDIMEAAVRDYPDVRWAREALIKELVARGFAARAAAHREVLNQP